MNAVGIPRSRLVTGILCVLLALGGSAGGLALVEIMSRLLFGTLDEHFQTGVASETDIDRRGGTSREDDGVRCTFGADGFREEATPGVFDRTVLFVGDSFTQGYGVADGASFPAQTARALARQGINARAANAGDAGAGAAQELRLLRRLLGRMKVDLVALQLFPQNDLDDNWEDGGFTVIDGRLVEVSPPRPPLRVAVGRWLGDHNTLLELNVVRLLGNVFLKPAPPALADPAIELEGLLLRETIVTARAWKVPIFFFVVGARNECAPTGQPGPQDAHARVLETVRSIGVPWLDSCPVTDSAAHYNESGHFIVAGNELIGEALAQRLAPMLRADPLARTAAADEGVTRRSP